MDYIKNDGAGSGISWFVGSTWRTGDQLNRFINDGIWENGYNDKYLDLVRAMNPGEKIAIKSSYTRKNELPFDSRGHVVSVLAIKAVGVITENFGDGKRIKVEWKRVEPTKEWYFYTYRSTIWRVMPGEWMNDALISFTFENKPQDIDRFRNEPFWKERFGDQLEESRRFQWTAFFEAIAEKLLQYSENRSALVEGLHKIAAQDIGLRPFEDRFSDGSSGPLQDICPFTVMGTFNRSMSDDKRKNIASAVATFLGITVPVPFSFEGVPLLNNQRSWFFDFADKRRPNDIDLLWKVFTASFNVIKSDSPEDKELFISAFDDALQISGVAWNLTTGLFWVHPWDMVTLDSHSRDYINNILKVELKISSKEKACNGLQYLNLIEDLRKRFNENEFTIHSFPDLSLKAWRFNQPKMENVIGDNPSYQDNNLVINETVQDTHQIELYSVDDIIKDGCFLPRNEVNMIIDRLRTKKNLILQGPPGTGKTWLAKRLGFALIGQKDDSKIRGVQFHPNLSYEDFVRGWRPSGDGKLSLADGIFMEVVRAAYKEPSSKFVFVIEEINRGNPAQIFGELLTLLEAGKRTPSEALELCYPDSDGVRRPVFIPDNLYVIGTMNIADRSLALVDLALRRRFAFVDLKPALGPVWREWIIRACNVDSNLAREIESRVNELNEVISGDPRLGKQFCIGHSYVTPIHRIEEDSTKEWFRQVVETEISPLLEEYWFDAQDEAQKATAKLLQGW